MKTRKDVVNRYATDIRDDSILIDILTCRIRQITKLSDDKEIQNHVRAMYVQLRARVWELMETNHAVQRCLRPVDYHYGTTADNAVQLRRVSKEIDEEIGPVGLKNGIYDLTIRA